MLKATNSVVSDGIWPKFKLIQTLMVVLVTCKNEEAQCKIKALEWSQHFSHYKSMEIFPDTQVQLTLQSLFNFETIYDFITVLAICKNEEDPIKNESTRVVTTLYIDFSDAQGQLTL